MAEWHGSHAWLPINSAPVAQEHNRKQQYEFEKYNGLSMAIAWDPTRPTLMNFSDAR